MPNNALVNSFRSTLINDDLISADTLLILGQFIETGRVTIPAGVAMAIGYGPLRGHHEAIGRAYADFKASATDIDGLLRLDLHNPQDRVIKTLFESRTESLRSTQTDRTVQLPFSDDTGVVFGEDWSLVLKIKADTLTDYTLVLATSIIMFDVTMYDVV